MKRTFYIASDHGGFELKEIIKKHVSEKGFDINDLGPFEYREWDDYPDYAAPVAESVQENENARGIVICTSGVGVSVVANKFKGVRAGLCYNDEHVESAVQDDNINVLALPSHYITVENALEAVDMFLEADFSEQERHARRLDKLSEIEHLNFK